MKVEVLGHLAGAPNGDGACSGYLISEGDTNVLLDCGPGTLSLLRKKNLTQGLDAIVLSHMDKDHVLDLVPFTTVRLMHALNGSEVPWTKPRLCVPKENGLEVLSRLDAIWARKSQPAETAGDPAAEAYFTDNVFSNTFEVLEYDEGDVVECGDLSVSFARTYHAEPCFSPRLTNGVATVVYSADAGYTPELVQHCRDADILLCESTLLELTPLMREHGHLTGEDAGRIAVEADVRRLVLTHLGPDPGEHPLQLQKARQHFQGIVDLASRESVYYA